MVIRSGYDMAGCLSDFFCRFKHIFVIYLRLVDCIVCVCRTISDFFADYVKGFHPDSMVLANRDTVIARQTLQCFVDNRAA